MKSGRDRLLAFEKDDARGDQRAPPQRGEREPTATTRRLRSRQLDAQLLLQPEPTLLRPRRVETDQRRDAPQRGAVDVKLNAEIRQIQRRAGPTRLVVERKRDSGKGRAQLFASRVINDDSRTLQRRRENDDAKIKNAAQQPNVRAPRYRRAHGRRYRPRADKKNAEKRERERDKIAATVDRERLRTTVQPSEREPIKRERNGRDDKAKGRHAFVIP